MPTVSSGQISMSSINAEFRRGYSLSAHRGVQWFTPNALPTGNFSSGQIKMSDFYNKSATDPATSGSMAWGPAAPTGATGYHTFIMPLYRNSMSIRVWAGGGGGGSGYRYSGNPGGDSKVYLPAGFTSPHAHAGGGGSGTFTVPGLAAGGPGGLAEGGNQLNNNGGAGYYYQAGNGGAGAQGGTHPFVPNSNGTDGGYPGAGGGGGQNDDYRGTVWLGGGGGGGAYVQSYYGSGVFTPGISIPVHVGAGGAGGTAEIGGFGGNGGAGRIEISWN